MEHQLGLVKARKCARKLLPGDGPKNGVMSPARVEEVDFPLAHFKGSLSLNEMTVERRGIALFKTAQMPG